MALFKAPNIDKLRAKGDTPRLIEALRDERQEVRKKAANALGRLGEAIAVEPLITALTDENGEVRAAAAGALGEVGDPRAVEPLLAVQRDEHSLVRFAAIGSLGELGDARAVEPLIATLTLDDWEARVGAAMALEALGDAQAVDPLIAALGDEEPLVRGQAARALGTLGDARAVIPLSGALVKEISDSVEIASLGGDTVRQAMSRALKELEARPGKQPAAEPSTGRAATAEPVKLAVMAHEEGPGSLRWIGEDANGRIHDLRDTIQAAVLFVPRETLGHLQQDQELWSRVKNPEVATDAPVQAQEMEPGGLLASILAGPLMNSAEHGDLAAGEFQVSVVDSYASAVRAVKGIELFG